MSLHAAALRVALLLTIGLLAPASAVADTTPPTIVSLGVTPAEVDVTDADAVVTVTAHVTDDTGVVAGTFFAFVRNGLVAGEDTMRLVDGTQQNGTQRTFITIPQGTAPGEYALEGRFGDSGGNFTTGFPAGTPTTLRVSLDSDVAPETTIDGGPSGTVFATNVEFTFFSSQATAGLECQLDGAAWIPCASPMSYADLAEGPHSFGARSVSAGGRVDPTPAFRDFDLRAPLPPDTVAPDTTIDAGPTGTVGQSAAFSFSSSEPGVIFECRLDAGRWVLCAAPRSYSNLAGGDHTFAARARDSAENYDPSPATRSFTVALPPPAPAAGGQPGPAPDPGPTAPGEPPAPGAPGAAAPSPGAPGTPQSTVTQPGAGSATSGAPERASTSPKRCKVPRLRGKSLSAARKALTKAGCQIGKVSKPKKVKRGTTLVVARQSGTKRIAVTLGPKPKPKRP